MTKLQSVLFLTALLNFQALASPRLPKGLRYETVFPRGLHSHHKRDVQSKYPDLVQYMFQLEGKPLVLHLEKTEGLIAENYTETRYLPDGTPVTSSPEIQDHCYYQGSVRHDKDSLVSLSTCSGLSGMILTRGRRFLIEPLNQTDSDAHAVYEAEDTPKTCGVTNTSYTEGKSTKSSRASSSTEKQAFLKSQKYIQVYIVADSSMFKKYNSSAETVKQRIFEVINYVNVVYKAINTFVALCGLEIWEKTDQFTVVSSPSKILDSFSTWRKEKLLPRKAHDNAQFITDTDFDGATVGLAFVGTMCSETHSSGVIQDHSRASIAVGATVAHEMGHNLGMNHDTSTCTCDASSCIMSPSLSYKTPRLFSSCSHQNFQEFIFDRMPLCMKDEPLKTSIQAPAVCGNKFTELGEDCDCGTVEECTNQCCDAATCKFKPDAKCADGECCEDCQIKKAGVVCRAVKDDCDLADLCEGNSAACPSDRFRVNGFPCRDGQGNCYNGKCPILQNQCAELWGASAVVGEDSCFKVNTRGTNYGYCLKIDGTYVPCGTTDTKCGVLYCSGGSDRPSVYAAVAEFSRCRGVLSNEGMVENGTKCGDGMVCYNGKCTSIESAFKSSNCSAKCPGHAVCDHELQCQCEEGWAPPTCDSASSTILQYPSSELVPKSALHIRDIVIIVVVIIIAIVLVITLVLLIKFRRGSLRWKQSSTAPPPTVSGATNPAFGGHQQIQIQSRSQSSTPELSSKNLLSPPPPPAQSQKPQVSNLAADKFKFPSRDGYQAPQYSVTSEVTKQEHKPKKPTTAPPPVPPAKPVLPTPPPKSSCQYEENGSQAFSCDLASPARVNKI
ncbi:zinc metalloproteinase-disintegrin-like VLAIP-B [Rhinophrynus dorsalis]